MSGYQMRFNQDFTSITVLSKNGFRLFSILSKDKVEEVSCKENEEIRIVERLFNSSLVVLVTTQKPNSLRMLHFRKKQDICNCVYPTDILCVRMNRQHLVVCLAESIHIHDIRDMKILHSIKNVAPNELSSLSLNSLLAYPICSDIGELQIFNAKDLRPTLTLRAHATPLSALSFSPDGSLLATASERGTVIRVFCVQNGQRVQEFRRGVKRCVRIASLVFSSRGDYLCVSSNTETVHIFKVDPKAVEAAANKTSVESKESAKQSEGTQAAQNKSEGADSTPCATLSASAGASWSGYLSKAVSSYLIPSQVSDALAQDRAFATAALAQPGMKHVIGLVRWKKQLQLLIACEDGFLYIHDFSVERGGPCKLLRMHDLRSPLEGVIELNLTDSMDQMPSDTIPAVVAAEVCEAASTETPETPANPAVKNGSDDSISVLLESPGSAPVNSYAGVLKGEPAFFTPIGCSCKYREVSKAINPSAELYDDSQFPPVATTAKK